MAVPLVVFGIMGKTAGPSNPKTWIPRRDPAKVGGGSGLSRVEGQALRPFVLWFRRFNP